MMFGWNEVLQIAASFIGTIGFGILFNIRGRRLRLAGLGGLLSWFLFLLLGFAIENEIVRYFIVSVAISAYAEVLARVVKTPTTTFCIVSLVPLVPGGSIYYTMSYAMTGQSELFIERGVTTLALTAALSLGIVLVTAVTKHLTAMMKKK